MTAMPHHPTRQQNHSKEPGQPGKDMSLTRFFAMVGLMAVIAAMAMYTSKAHAAGLLIADGGFGGRLEIQEHTVDVVINNGVAVTTIEQKFLNTENRTVEALYTFPVPQNASVANFAMWINGKEMTGEVVEKERAREIYNSYKQQPKPRDPGLLEQVDYKTFELRIFPILPNAVQRIKIVYYQQLDFDHDWATYVYPLSTTTTDSDRSRNRNGGQVQQQVTGKFALRLRVKSEIPITEMTSPSHKDEFIVASHTRYAYEASLEAAGGDLSRDLVLAYHTARPKTGVDIITSKPKGEDGYFMMTLTSGKEMEQFPLLTGGKDYVFVLDISGSMANEGKLPLSKNTLSAFINGLGAVDRFELINFNIQPTSTFNQLRSATDDAKTQAVAVLNSQLARGGTQLDPALAMAYKYADPDRPLIIVILSDGMTEQSERRDLLAKLNQRPANARVFAIGVGNAVNRPLLSQIAGDAGGLAAFLSQGDDFERQAKAFRRKLMRPIATDLKLAFNGAEVYDLEPQTATSLYHGAPIRVYGRYKGSSNADAKLSISGNMLGREFTQNVALNLPATDGGNPEIERMWAWHRVDRLLKEADRNGSRDSVTAEIIRLGEGYSIVTEYTSFLVLENDGEYKRWNLKRRNALRMERDLAAQQAVRDELEQIRAKAANAMGPAAPDSQNIVNPIIEREAQVASNQPQTQTQQQTQNNSSNRSQPQRQPEPSRGQDFNFGGGGGGGGGAVDPITAGIVLVLAGSGLTAVLRKKKRAA